MGVWGAGRGGGKRGVQQAASQAGNGSHTGWAAHVVHQAAKPQRHESFAMCMPGGASLPVLA